MSQKSDQNPTENSIEKPRGKGGNRGKEKPDRVRVIPFQRQLSCTLTREELLCKGSEQSALLSRRDGIEEALKAAQKAGKAQIAETEASMRRVSGEVRDRAELRLVQCERRIDWEHGTVTEIRCDTGEEVSSRHLSEDEKQKELDFGDGDVESEFGGDGGE
jgi:hypothetical protein